MKILIVANNPINVGGVMNYTRPLANQFVMMGHKVYYLYSGTWDKKYNILLRAYIKRNNSKFNYETAEIVNSEILTYNFGRPEIDMHSKQIEALFIQYLDEIKPDIMHIHSRVGFPASINEIAYKKGIVVCNTIHTYGYICQKRVMIDYEGVPCFGPSSLNKCALCTGTLNYRKERLRVLLWNYNNRLKVKSPFVFNLLQQIKRYFKSSKQINQQVDTKPCGCENESMRQLAIRLTKRLKYCTDTLSMYSDRILCVSNDVKTTLMNYGVNECKLLVQHIGSTIAEKQVVNDHPLHDPIVIGNIGGVNYYKGIHVFMEALAKIRNSNFIVRIYGKYEEKYFSDLIERFNNLPIEFTGRYKPEDLPEILRQIDVMVLPSICNDTAPQTIFESFSGGVPIIASNIGGFPDFVRHERNGLLFEAGNSEDLAQKIDFILEHPDRLSVYRKNIPGLKTITENATELLSLYNDLLCERNAARQQDTI